MGSTPDPAKKTDTPKGEKRPPNKPPMKDLATSDKSDDAIKGGMNPMMKKDG